MTDALKQPHPDVPFFVATLNTVGDATITALATVAAIFKNIATTFTAVTCLSRQLETDAHQPASQPPSNQHSHPQFSTACEPK
jgi:hypothetical protein